MALQERVSLLQAQSEKLTSELRAASDSVASHSHHHREELIGIKDELEKVHACV